MREASSLLIVAALAACDRPQPIVICHNSNCVGPDPARDDNVEALQQSLEQTWDGRPVLDGLEWDMFWYGKDSKCLFAHDLDHDTTIPASAPAAVVANYLATRPQVSWSGDPFYVLIDLKAHVGPSYSDAHTPQQLIDHAECAIDTAEQLLAGARAGGHELRIGFITGKPQLFNVLVDRPRYEPLTMEAGLQIFLIGDIFAPYADIVPKLEDFTDEQLDAVEYHPDFMTAEHRETYRSLELQLVQWSYVATTEALQAIEKYEPELVITNEATFLRRWTEN